MNAQGFLASPSPAELLRAGIGVLIVVVLSGPVGGAGLPRHREGRTP